MKGATWIGGVAVVTTVFAVGCGGDTRQDGSAAIASDAALAADGGEADSTVTLALGCTTLNGNQPIADVEYCPADGHGACGTTDSSGFAVLSNLPAHASFLYTLEKPGYVTLLKHFRTGEYDGREAFDKLIPVEALDEWADSAGVSLNPKLGHIGFLVVNGAGSTVTARPKTGIRIHLEMRDGLLKPTLEPGNTSTALGLFLNVAPGEYEVVFSHPDRRCSFGMEAGWPGSTPDSTKLVVRAGMLSWPAFGGCLPPAAGR